MRGLAWGVLFLGVLAIKQPAQAAGFDCAQARSPIEKAICADPELSRLDGEMSEKYWAAYALLQGFDRQDLQDDQFSWLERRITTCRFESADDLQDARKLACLRRTTQYMINNLTSWRETSRTIVVEDTPKTQELCSVVLNKTNIIWVEGDRYDLRYLTRDRNLPKQTVVAGELLRLADITDSKFDFLNIGHPNAVLEVFFQQMFNVFYRGWAVHWYIALAPGEEQAIKDRIAQASQDRSMNYFDQLAADLQHGAGDYGIWPPQTPWATSFRRKSTPLKSHIIDLANHDLIKGWNTPSIILSLGKTTYILAHSLSDDNRGAVAALFRPHPSGALDLLCYHRLPRSYIRQRMVKDFGRPNLCPIGHKVIPIDSKTGDYPFYSATVFLNGWGGLRPLIMAPNGFHVGTLNATDARDDENWPPLVALERPPEDDGYYYLMITDQGGFFASRDGLQSSRRQNKPRTTTYYYIENNGLTPVCVGADIPPAGYALH